MSEEQVQNNTTTTTEASTDPLHTDGSTEVFNTDPKENPFSGMSKEELEKAYKEITSGSKDIKDFAKTPTEDSNTVEDSVEVQEETKTEEKEEVEVKAEEAVPEDLSEYGDFVEFHKELQETGDLSEKSVDKIVEQYKLPKKVVKEYIDTMKAYNSLNQQVQGERVKKELSELMEYAGGEEMWGQVKEWAQKNLEESALESYTQSLLQGDLETRKLIIDGLKVKAGFLSGEKIPNKITGTPSSTQSLDVFESDESYMKALSNVNPSNIDQVRKFQDKVNRSIKAGYIKDPRSL